jgi:Glycosyl transferase family 2
MISLILPYWSRPNATNRAMALLAENYPQLDMEMIVVDDGSPSPYVLPDGMPWPTRVIHLEPKMVPKNPCVPYNIGVADSDGDLIAISNPEILHKMPVLGEMAEAIDDDKTYVLAAAWCQEQRRWHCHSNMNRGNDNDVGAYLPKGTNYHFMGMMRRELWEAAGGFDEEYRDGAGYDDPDFVRRLHKAGAKFLIRDDLIVEHPRNGARADWTAEGYARNRALFMSKWQPC